MWEYCQQDIESFDVVGLFSALAEKENYMKIWNLKILFYHDHNQKV